jgi:hypothetical protein
MNVQLADDIGNSNLEVWNNSGSSVLKFPSTGDVEFTSDNSWIGRGASSGRVEFIASGSAVALYSGTDLVVYSDAGSAQKAFWDGATGAIGVGASAITGLVHLEQSSLTGAKPCITLDQADLDREYLRLIGTTASATNSYALLGPEFSSAPDLAGWFRIYVQDDNDLISDGYFYTPFYVAPTAQ